VGAPQTDPKFNAEFLGGPPELFVSAGREQLLVLLDEGLSLDSYLLDVGCGPLRGARWTIPLLDAGHYFGIEPQKQMVEKGLAHFIDPEIVHLRRPTFDWNDRFDFSVFGRKFTHFMARSIWTHCSKKSIETMLDGFVAWSEPEGVFLASLKPAKPFGLPDYQGDEWVGKSHESTASGSVAHSLSWLREQCRRRGLTVRTLDREPLQEKGQIWSVIRRG
jgi:SAM-dependent methyltransferase